MVIHAVQNSSKAQRLIEILNMHTEEESLLKEAVEIIQGAGSLEYAKKFKND